MLRIARVVLCVSALAWTTSGAGQDLSLTTDCEAGFREFIHLAESDGVGSDVKDANIDIADDKVRVELVRVGAPNKLLFLTRKRSRQPHSRYFDITLGDNANASDMETVGKALDRVFHSDPFHIIGVEASPDGEPIPGLMEAWNYDGWSGVVQACERRTMVLASLEYTVGVIAVVALALLTSLAIMWGGPPRS